MSALVRRVGHGRDPLLHHARGLTAGVLELADALRHAGHTVHAPTSSGGRSRRRIEGAGFEEKAIGWEGMLQRTEAAAERLPADIVHRGMSLGVVYGTRLAVLRPGARARADQPHCHHLSH